MDHYAGIDVSLEQSSVCIVDASGKIIREGKVASEPQALIDRLAVEKDVATLVEAARRTDTRVVVAGSGPDEERLREGSPPNVAFEGFVPPERVASLLSTARALVLPSLSYEGAPISVLEAYAAGVPVIANRIGALSELVEDGETGLLVEPRDVDDLAAALERLSDDGESERMGGRARSAWEARFSPEHGLAGLERGALGEKQRQSLQAGFGDAVDLGVAGEHIGEPCSERALHGRFIALGTLLGGSLLGTLRARAIAGAASDHPVLPAFPEGRYLKFLFFDV